MRCNHVTRTTFCSISVFVQKAELCDAYDWDAYLELYDEDSEYHIPQWIDDHNYVQDPNQGLSYIYYADRTGLEDRVFRIRTGKAASATPLPRTLHSINNIRVKTLDDGLIEAKVAWQTLYNRQSLEGCFTDTLLIFYAKQQMVSAFVVSTAFC